MLASWDVRTGYLKGALEEPPMAHGYITIYCGQGGFCVRNATLPRALWPSLVRIHGLFSVTPLPPTHLPETRLCQLVPEKDSPLGARRSSCPPLRSTSECDSGCIRGRAKVKREKVWAVRLWSRLHAGEECVHAVQYIRACISVQHFGNRRGNVG